MLNKLNMTSRTTVSLFVLLSSLWLRSTTMCSQAFQMTSVVSSRLQPLVSSSARTSSSSLSSSSLSSSTARYYHHHHHHARRQQQQLTRLGVAQMASLDVATAATTAANNWAKQQIFSGSPPPIIVSHLKQFYVVQLEQWYQETLALKCPFMRRRKLDMLEGIESFVRQLISILDLTLQLPPKLSCRGNRKTWIKQKHLAPSELVERIRYDWREQSSKGYYITGKLDSSIYRDDCLFDGPDPDMPIRGLIKYVQVACQLFDASVSTAELVSLQYSAMDATIHATWRMNAVMRLPWRPQLPQVFGTTTYYLDHDHLIYKHTETWDISVGKAFQSIIPPWEFVQNKLLGKHDYTMH